MKKHTVSICTLGCRVNQYESDAIAEALEKEGFIIVPFGEKCDVSVINTCSVTAESDRKSRQLIRKAQKFSGASRVIVTGCSSQISPDEIKKIEGVGAIIGNAEKETIPSVIMNMLAEKEYSSFDITDIAAAKYDSFEISHARRTRAYIKIEDGCENKCAYCIIPKARGKIRSKEHDKIIEEISEVSKSCPEIILTGIEVASYGRDRGEREALTSLLCEADKTEGVSRLTLGSLDPNVITDDFLSTVSHLDSFLPHLHLSIQSGCTTVLNRMRRKYTAEKALERINNAKRIISDISFSADIIVGFPGESEEEFEKTVLFCKEAKFMHLHIFPYSIRTGTEAASMPDQIPEKTKKERCRKLAEVQKEIKAALLDEYVKRFSKGGCNVLFEQKKDGINTGHSPQYIEIRVEDNAELSNKILDVALISHDGERCLGKVITE